MMSEPTRRAIAAVVVLCAVVLGLAPARSAPAETGIASIYSGKRTAGPNATASNLTAAHRTLPFGTLVQVTSEKTGRSVVVRIVDRGPFIRGRVIDVSPTAAQALGFSGLTHVTLMVVGKE